MNQSSLPGNEFAMRFKRAFAVKLTLWRLLSYLAIICLTLASYASLQGLRHIDDAYAQWGAADMVIGHMRDHKGEWPRNWESLEPYFRQGNGRVGGWSFEQFQSHIFIDFDADPRELQRLSLGSQKVPFNVIRAKSYWSSQIGEGPNALLHQYFRSEERTE